MTIYHKNPAGNTHSGGVHSSFTTFPETGTGPAFRLALFLIFGRLDEKKFCLLQVLRYRRVVKQTSGNCYKSFKSRQQVFSVPDAIRRKRPPALPGTPLPGRRPPERAGWGSLHKKVGDPAAGAEDLVPGAVPHTVNAGINNAPAHMGQAPASHTTRSLQPPGAQSRVGWAMAPSLRGRRWTAFPPAGCGPGL